MHTRDEVFLFLMRKLEALTDVCAAHATIGLWRSTSNTADPRSAAVWKKGSHLGSGIVRFSCDKRLLHARNCTEGPCSCRFKWIQAAASSEVCCHHLSLKSSYYNISNHVQNLHPES